MSKTIDGLRNWCADHARLSVLGFTLFGTAGGTLITSAVIGLKPHDFQTHSTMAIEAVIGNERKLCLAGPDLPSAKGKDSDCEMVAEYNASRQSGAVTKFLTARKHVEHTEGYIPLLFLILLAIAPATHERFIRPVTNNRP
jgi:hypothetical protein